MATRLLSGAMCLLGIFFWVGRNSCEIQLIVTEESDKLNFPVEVIVLGAKARRLKHQPLGFWLQLIKLTFING